VQCAGVKVRVELHRPFTDAVRAAHPRALPGVGQVMRPLPQLLADPDAARLYPAVGVGEPE
jgi:hypothetical protein